MGVYNFATVVSRDLDHMGDPLVFQARRHLRIRARVSTRAMLSTRVMYLVLGFVEWGEFVPGSGPGLLVWVGTRVELGVDFFSLVFLLSLTTKTLEQGTVFLPQIDLVGSDIHPFPGHVSRFLAVWPHSLQVGE